ncbi:MAG TPA: ATP-dependent DNA helicase, partial [Rhodopila sp.]|nr:ATP-dependent DNA helicase [Rhodopila sp.]
MATVNPVAGWEESVYVHPVKRTLALPDSPAVVAGFGHASILTPDGELLTLPTEEAAALLRTLPPPILVHAPATFRRLAMRPGPAFDLLELFAFARPGEGAAPTPRGLAQALDHDDPPAALEDQAALLPDLALQLLNHLARGRDTPVNRDAAGLAARMGRAGWGWSAYVMEALGQPDAAASIDALKVWRRLPEFEETAVPPPPSAYPVTEAEARIRLAQILGANAEQRPGQADYAGAATAAFEPRETKGDPHLVLAEAGTGTGKTLGYLAPASVWAEKNKGPVWISTFTRHLQRQIETEVGRIWPDPTERRANVVVRKGRENYLCLLNLEEAVNNAASGFLQNQLVPLGLISRWAAVSEDGDIHGGDLPGWLGELHGGALIASLADRRGECIHGACTHYRRCFVEHTIRRARTARLVVANHALVMVQAAWGGLDDSAVPTRYVFDEGHHVFDAADGAFSATLSGLETSELRRWLLGAEGGRSRSRGLARRVEDLVADRANLKTPLDAILQAARALPGVGWTARLTEEGPELDGVEPRQSNPTEQFLRLVRQQVMARTSAEDWPRARPNPYGTVECDVHPLNEPVAEAADRLARALGRLAEPVETLRTRLLARAEDEAEDMDTATRTRIEAIARSLDRRAVQPLRAWRSMLTALAEPDQEPGDRPGYVPFFRLDRRDGNRDFDVGLHRHWLDPTVPFALT